MNDPNRNEKSLTLDKNLMGPQGGYGSGRCGNLKC
jgi:hypothetical protein